MTLLDWSSSRSGMKMLTTVGLTLAHDVKGTLFSAIRNVFHSYFEDYLVLSIWSLWMNSVSTPAYGLNGTRSASSTIASGL